MGGGKHWEASVGLRGAVDTAQAGLAHVFQGPLTEALKIAVKARGLDRILLVVFWGPFGVNKWMGQCWKGMTNESLNFLQKAGQKPMMSSCKWFLDFEAKDTLWGVG